jgi:hypothetical protein
VQFKRTVAKDGRIRVADQIWDNAKFANSYENMSALEAKLDRLIQLLKPVEVPPFGFDWFASPSPAQRLLGIDMTGPMSPDFPGGG